MPARAGWHRYVRSVIRHDEHRDAWEYLLAREATYPSALNVAPWKWRIGRDRSRPVAMIRVYARSVPHTLYPAPYALAITDGASRHIVTCHNDGDRASTLASALFRPDRCGTLYVAPGISGAPVASILAWCVPHWASDGYVIRPIQSRGVLLALRIKRGRGTWTIATWSAVTGETDSPVTWDTGTGSIDPHDDADIDRSMMAHLCIIQNTLLAGFGTQLRTTMGATAIGAATRYLPQDVKIFRPHPLLITMCRDGGAYTGGYVMGNPYRGYAYKIDVRRLYTWCLTQPLPIGWGFGDYERAHPNRPGIYMVTLRGSSCIRPAVCVWSGPEMGFVRTRWDGGTTVCVMASPDIDAMRALGYDVDMGAGFGAIRMMTLSGFVDQIQRVITQYGADTRLGAVIKLVGNAVSGKFAVRPKYRGMVWSQHEPPNAIFPALTNTGEEIPDCWWTESTSYVGYQQIAMAAFVTAYGRARLYDGMYRIIVSGGDIVHAHTDGILATGTVPTWVYRDTDTIGAWRLAGDDRDAIVARAGGYAIGGETKWSGAHHVGRPTVELAYTTRSGTL